MALENKILPGAGVDLHTHSVASDGRWSSRNLVDAAHEQGVQTLSLTDHDTIRGIKQAMEQARTHRMTLIPGVEMTISWKGSIHHLLLYGFDPNNAGLNAMLDDTRRRQKAKAQEMIDALSKRGFRTEELAFAGGAILTSPSRALAKAISNIDKTLSFDHALQICQKIEPHEKIAQPAEKALAIGVAAGGIPVLAHPARSGREVSYASVYTMYDLLALGLEGLEAYHYSHSPMDVFRMLRFAKQNGLVVSGGSDTHGRYQKPIAWNPMLFSELLERLGVKQNRVAA